jgi:outer membrane protein TolC
MAAYGQRDGGRSDMLMLEVGVSLPMFGRNRQDRDVSAREAEYRQASALQEDQRRELVAELDAAFSRWEALKRQVALHEDRLLPLARDRSAAALAAYRGGGALQPWLDARAAELQVHQDHAEHLGELARAWAALAFLLPEATP